MHEIDRTRRVSALLKRELATLISRELNDGRLQNVTINAVTISKDLKNATIFVSTLDDALSSNIASNATANTTDTSNKIQQEKNQTKHEPIDKLLNNAAKFLRRLLSQQADLRITPNLRFKYDDSIQRGVEMSSLINSLNRRHGTK
jgi:ribosome-binding factor A